MDSSFASFHWKVFLMIVHEKLEMEIIKSRSSDERGRFNWKRTNLASHDREYHDVQWIRTCSFEYVAKSLLPVKSNETRKIPTRPNRNFALLLANLWTVLVTHDSGANLPWSDPICISSWNFQPLNRSIGKVSRNSNRFGLQSNDCKQCTYYA